MRRLAILLSCVLLTPALGAEEPPEALAEARTTAQPRAVIEMYTSQGCSDCPAADALLKQFLDKRDVIGLTLPVDYWDYLGWKDTLAGPRNSERQREYADRFGTGTVYTPQAIVNGAVEVIGSSQSEIERAISATETALSVSRVPVHFWHYGNSIVIEAGSAPQDADPKEATIWLAIVQKKVDIEVKAGENKGKTLTYYNVVRELTPVGVWNGRPTTIRLARLDLMRPDSEDLVVLIQETRAGPIIGAARLGD